MRTVPDRARASVVVGRERTPFGISAALALRCAEPGGWRYVVGRDHAQGVAVGEPPNGPMPVAVELTPNGSGVARRAHRLHGLSRALSP